MKALYSLSIAFYGFTDDETLHMKEVTMENGGQPVHDFTDPQCTHIVINDQAIKQLPSGGGGGGNDPSSSSSTTTTTNETSMASSGSEPSTTTVTTLTITTTPTTTANQTKFNPNLSPFANTKASVVRAEWFWASIQICCRASECLYEFTKPHNHHLNGLMLAKTLPSNLSNRDITASSYQQNIITNTSMPAATNTIEVFTLYKYIHISDVPINRLIEIGILIRVFTSMFFDDFKENLIKY